MVDRSVILELKKPGPIDIGRLGVLNDALLSHEVVS
jgi:hypothetical protein